MQIVQTLTANPFYSPQLYDVLYAADQPNPGVAVVTGASTIYKWDKKDGPGAAGAFITFRGLDLAEFKIECKLWTPQHLEEWPYWSALWGWNPIKKTAQPLRVYHPLLDERGIQTVAAKTVPQLTYQGGGLWKGEIDVIEWRPPPKKNVASTPIQVGNEPVVQNEKQATIKRLSAIALDLAHSPNK